MCVFVFLFAATDASFQKYLCKSGNFPKVHGFDKQYQYNPRESTLNPKLTDPAGTNDGHQFSYNKFHDYVRGESNLAGVHM